MKKYENLILLSLVVLLAAVPLVWNSGAEFGGADDQVKDVVAAINPDYKPWFESLWSPPSTEVESFLFALQAAIGAGFIGYYIGGARMREKMRREMEEDASKRNTA